MSVVWSHPPSSSEAGERASAAERPAISEVEASPPSYGGQITSTDADPGTSALLDGVAFAEAIRQAIAEMNEANASALLREEDFAEAIDRAVASTITAT